MKTELPSRGTGLSYIESKKSFYAIYYVDGKQARQSLSTTCIKEAKKSRDRLFRQLEAEGATIRGGATIKEKIAANRSLYIYERPAFIVKCQGVFVGEAATRVEAEEMLDAYVAVL
jgi:hypothetical protein